MSIHFVERAMTDPEFSWLCARIDEYTAEHEQGVQTHEQHGFVALVGNTFIGSASGRAYKEGGVPTGWFYLSDLYVEAAYRKQGLGALLLRQLEARGGLIGARNIWTDTAGYEAPGFYKKQGYAVFCERENRYATGHSEVFLRKPIKPGTPPHGEAETVPGCRIEERLMTPAEQARMNAGFDEHTIEHGNPIMTPSRYGFVALDGNQFIGGVSGLASRNWFFVTDLFVQKSHRTRGVGTDMLQKMEERAAVLGSKTVWVWGLSHEAAWFSEKHGYEVCCRYPDWTRAGHSRVGLRKNLAAS